MDMNAKVTSSAFESAEKLAPARSIYIKEIDFHNDIIE